MLEITLTEQKSANEAEQKEAAPRKKSIRSYLLEKIQVWINSLLEAERDEFLQRKRGERLASGPGNYRNGYRRRILNMMGMGDIELKVPRDRNGEYQSAWLPARRSLEPEMEAFIAESFLAGLSTRDLSRITEKHFGHGYDSKQISRIVERATTELESWRKRPLGGRKYKFLYVDGANFRVRINGKVSRQSFCAVLGVNEEAENFEVLALEMGDRERPQLWDLVFRGLLERGLDALAVELGIMDGLPGLEGVFSKHFPRAQTQRCQKHAKANACQRVRKKDREEFSQDVNKIFYAANESSARKAFHDLGAKWNGAFPSAVGVLAKDLDSLLTFFQFEATYWTVLRTTNPIERLNKEFKRRTRAMEVTGGEVSTYRCLVYVAQTMEYRWSFHPLSQWASIYTQNAA